MRKADQPWYLKTDKDYDEPGFLVRAVEKGYYGVAMREPGDVFKISFARHFADVNDKRWNGLGWMERVEGKGSKRQAVDQDNQPRGAKPPPPPPEEREQRMSQVDKMAEEVMAEEAAKAEADVI